MPNLKIYYYQNTNIETETVSKPLSLKLKPFETLNWVTILSLVVMVM